MAQPLPLLFDERDKPAVIAHLDRFTGGVNSWEFAQTKVQDVFDDLLSKHKSITDYLGGKPLDSAIADGVLHPVHKGLGIVFVLSTGKTAFGSLAIYSASDMPVADETIVIAKFWISASSVTTGNARE